MELHDKHVDYSFYRSRWKKVSTYSLYAKKDYICKGSGHYKYGIFNHYIVKDSTEDVIKNNIGSNIKNSRDTLYIKPYYYHPLVIYGGITNKIGLEEIRYKRDIVGAAYNYYTNNIVINVLKETIVSVFYKEFKSMYFNITAFILEIKEETLHPGILYIEVTVNRFFHIVSLDSNATSAILDKICINGVTPIISPLGRHSL